MASCGMIYISGFMNIGSQHPVAYYLFTTFEGFKKQAACETANN
jgi:hypothetical protein